MEVAINNACINDVATEDEEASQEVLPDVQAEPIITRNKNYKSWNGRTVKIQDYRFINKDNV